MVKSCLLGRNVRLTMPRTQLAAALDSRNESDSLFHGNADVFASALRNNNVLNFEGGCDESETEILESGQY